MYINNPGHMTKMAAMPIYGKNPSKIFFSGTGRLISTKLGHETSMTQVLQCVYTVFVLISAQCAQLFKIT